MLMTFRDRFEYRKCLILVKEIALKIHTYICACSEHEVAKEKYVPSVKLGTPWALPSFFIFSKLLTFVDAFNFRISVISKEF